MKIVIAALYPIYPERIGGMDRFFWAFQKKLLENGFNPIWIFPYSDSFEHYKQNNIYPVFLEKDSFDFHLNSWLHKNAKFDILITHFVAYNTKYPAQWKKNVKKLICVDHMSRPRIKRPFTYRFRYFFKGLLNFRNIDHIIAVSPYVKKCIKLELGFWWSFLVNVIYNGVDTEYFRRNASISKKPYLFCIGHISEEKGFQDVINSLYILKNKSIQVDLKIAGSGPYLPSLQNLVYDLGMSNQVEFLGSLTNQNFYFNESILTIIPSWWNEACPFTVLEALSCGAYIFASNVGGIKDLIDMSHGETFKRYDVQKLSELIYNFCHQYSIKPDFINSFVHALNPNFSLECMVNNHFHKLSQYID